MKPTAFVHHAPRSVAEAVTLLAQVAGDEGRILAGGQTLVPAMALRLARPSHLVDINGIDELQSVKIAAGRLEIGACVRHAAFHRPVESGPLGQLLSTVVRHIAHLPIRNRGTFCGSLANADAASEWCLVSATLDATLVARSVRGERRIPAADFFRGFMATALEPDEMLVSAQLPLLAAGARFGFEEYARRAGDFAQAMSLVTFTPANGKATGVRIGVGGVESHPRRMAAAEAVLEGQAPADELFRRAAEAAASAVEPVEPEAERQDYKRDLVRTVVLRALQQASASSSSSSSFRSRGALQ
jgi:aerobic carbon-monoxide dehydrogenase medium subunit